MADSGKDFGQRTPPLSVFLQKILGKYADGSQLNELLQNADDAGATKIKFLLDVRDFGTAHPRGTLIGSPSAPDDIVCARVSSKL